MNSFSNCDALRAKLEHKLMYPCKPIAFVVGSGLTRGTVPGVTQIISTMRKYLEQFPDPDLITRFNAEVANRMPSERYQHAASFLLHNQDQDAVNRVIRACVFKACESMDYRKVRAVIENEEALRVLERTGRWKLDPGVQALGQLLRLIPDDVRGPVLTTNFDPLIEVAVRGAGAMPSTQWLDGDGRIVAADDPGEVRVIHMHGLWRRGDTLNTALQLTNPRQELDSSIRETLRGHVVVVLGYGGWSDVFTKSLRQRIKERQGLGMEVAWAEYQPLNDTLLTQGILGEMRTLPHVSFYGQVDANIILPELVTRLKGRTLPKLSQHPKPPIPKVPKI